MGNSKFFFSLIFGFFFFCSTIVYSQSASNVVVLVKYKTLPEKENMALAELKNLISKVKGEPHFVTIVVHVDPMDKSNILLYEEWSDEAYYKGDHMNTPHLQQFIAGSRAFLAGPPDITFWTVEK